MALNSHKSHFHQNKNIKAEKLITLFPSSGALHTLTKTCQDVFESRKLDFPPHLDGTWCRIVGSSNGLVLVETVEENMFLINPTSLKYFQLPKSPSAIEEYTRCSKGVGYDAFSDDYKVVTLPGCFNRKPDLIIHVYSLKENCWKFFESPYFFLGYYVSGVLLRNALHWVGFNRSHGSLVIAAFDLSSEEFRDIAICDDANLNLDPQLAVLQGCLCVFIEDPSVQVDIWMMKEYGVQGSWIKLIRLPYGFDIASVGNVIGKHELIVLYNENPEIYDAKERRHSMFVVDGDPATSATTARNV